MTRRELTDVYFRVGDDDPDQTDGLKHAYVEVVGAIRDVDDDPAAFGHPSAEHVQAAKVHVGGVLARALVWLLEDIEVERVMHGCGTRTPWVVTDGDPRRLKSGDQLGPGDHVHLSYSGHCYAYGHVDVHDPTEDMAPGINFTVPANRRKAWVAKVTEALEKASGPT